MWLRFASTNTIWCYVARLVTKFYGLIALWTNWRKFWKGVVTFRLKPRRSLLAPLWWRLTTTVPIASMILISMNLPTALSWWEITKLNYYLVYSCINNKTFTSTLQFKKTNQQISYVDYYKQRQKPIIIKDTRQPLLISVPRDMNRRQQGQNEELVKLVPELCLMTGLSEKQRADFRLMKVRWIHNLIFVLPLIKWMFWHLFRK